MAAGDYQTYFNTFIFTLVSCVCLLGLLLALLYAPAVAEYGVMGVTVAAGLLLIVVASIVRIVLHERRAAQRARWARDSIVAVQTCPDYYTAAYQDDGTLDCTSGSLTADGSATVTFSGGPASISLAALDSMTLEQVCSVVDPTDPKDPNYNIPWTDLRSKCTGNV